MAEKTKIEVIVICESVLQSWARDIVTVALFLALIGIGWLIGSAAMQWVGAIVAFITVWQRATARVRRLSIAAARDKLDELEREAAHG